MEFLNKLFSKKSKNKESNKNKNIVRDVTKLSPIGEVTNPEISANLKEDIHNEFGYNECLDNIKNLDKFTIEFDTLYKGSIDIRDKEFNSFIGEYVISKNKEFIVAYKQIKHANGYSTSGEVYLFKNKKLLWQKKTGNVGEAFVSDNGLIILMLEVWYDCKCFPYLYIIDKTSKILFKKKFESSTKELIISKDENELIIFTCSPEFAVYLFSIKEKKLIKKINKETLKKYLVYSNFKNIKKIIMKERSYTKLGDT